MSLLARFSLANRGLVALIAVVLTGFGLFAVPSLKQQLLPSLEYPGAFVIAAYPGAAPEIVEAQVTEPIENSIQGIAGLNKVTSTSREGVATIQVEYEFGTDIDAAVNKMQTALGRIASQLPEGVEPTVLTGTTDDLPAVILAAGGGGDERALADKLRNAVVPELEAIDGVRTVEVTGARDQSVVITPDPVKLAKAKVQPTAIAGALQANGVSIPAGTLTGPERSLTVQVGSRIETLDELRGIYLTAPGAPPVRLGDIATVEQQLDAPTSYTRTNGKDSLGIAVTAKPDGNAVQISHDIRDRLADLRTASGAELNVVLDQAPYVEKSIKSLTTEGLLGLVMAVLVILVFLLSVRSTLVTAVSIPLSMVVALLALWIGDYSLNLLTLGALTIAVGRVVDDSIVVLENIKRHLGYGERKREAIIKGVREVAGAVTASTLTTVAVFAPIALVGGFVGQIFAPFAITVTVALLASLLVSLTVIPVLSYWFLKPATGVDAEAVRQAAEEKELRDPLQRRYLPVIEFATRRRWLTLGLGLLVLIGTFGLSTGLKTNFLDQSGQDTLSFSQEMPVGTSLAATDAAARKVEEVLARTPEVTTYQVTVGGGGMPWESGGSKSSFSLALTEDADAEQLTERLRTELTALNAGEISFGAGGGAGMGSTNQVAVVVQASDPEVLTRAAEQAQQAMAETPDVADVSTNLTGNSPRIEVVVDRAAAARVGMSEAAVGQLVAQVFRGSPVGRVVLDNEQQDVVLRLGAGPTSVEALRALPIGPVKLDDIAEISEVKGPLEVTRIDGDRSATVTGTATGSNLGETTEALKERLDKLDVPGATFTLAGVSADQEEAFADLGLAVLAAIAIVFLIMVATFRSLIQPLILLVSIPFAATGAIGLLLATGTPLGVPALIGVLMLVGIVVTNAIVLLDLVNQYRDQGMGVREAVIEGGRRRLRPILMTAIATIFALLPMAFGLTGEGGFISQPLAIVVIGGLISSTLLTLVLVPTLYTMVENTKERIRRRRSGGGAGDPAGPVGTTEEPAGVVSSTVTSNGAQAPVVASGDGPDRVESPVSAATSAEARPAPSGALVDGTDQFEVLRLPKSRRSPLPPSE
ncbi:efflux RND transporter permease subunit [Micromonospora polyrhachis]|uniref:HAE1 family hydrophobic/amphiphilic exporter-1 n=1 Tax=Micromonospora polyrhachis TaxID=1282883 RepID=A0A7W7SU03_9ACTN|nr:efflux RND transporter permease subunit [Micromonospora polyrhachis]MBB4960297.1 HAE1 family hydrophobic/amphiphilic exporter-1 [Micromonospora polyrhachis]